MATGNRLVDCEERGCSICRTTQFELKCLPCAHNVCTECLHNVTDDLSGRTPSVYCPVDSSEFPLKSINGIDSLPTKGHLVEVSSRTDGYFLHWSPDMGSNVHDDTSDNPEMHELLTYTQEYRNDLADTIRNMEHGIQASLSLQEERVKEEIRSTSEALVKVISAKEQELYQEVDRVIEAEKKGGQQEVADFALQAHHIIQVVEVNHAKFKEGRRDESLMKQVHTELQAVKKHKSVLEEKLKCVSEISFVPNEYCFEAPLGRVKCNRPAKEQEIPRRKSMEDGPSRRSSTQGQLKRKPSQVFRVIVPPSPLSEKFRPWALSVSETGHIAVVDRGNNCIHIFNPKGDFLRYVAKPYGSKSVELYGVTFVSRNTFALAEYSPSPGSGCLLEMSISGEHLRIIGNLKGPAHVTSFPSTSNACKNVIAVYYTNSFDSPDVFVAKDEQKVCLPLGRNALSRPQKGVFLKEKLIFSDSNEVRNKGCVKVFHSDGRFSHCFGEQPLWNEESLGHPLRIAADPVNCYLLVYQQFSNRMRVFDVTGACISEFATTSGLLDFAISPEGRLIGTCSNNSEFPNSVVILSYM